MIDWTLMLLTAYFVGAVPFGVMIGLMKGVDIREHGSRNIGATNCGRVLGRKFGIICLLLDACKGFGPVFGAGFVLGYLGGGASGVTLGAEELWMWMGVAVAAVLGHMFPVYLRFRGGKGVATGFGVVLGVWPFLTIPAIGILLTWVAMVVLFRYVSLASVAAAVMLPVYVILNGMYVEGMGFGDLTPLVIVAGVLGTLIVYAHRSNLRRLMRGEEPKLGIGGGK